MGRSGTSIILKQAEERGGVTDDVFACISIATIDLVGWIAIYDGTHQRQVAVVETAAAVRITTIGGIIRDGAVGQRHNAIILNAAAIMVYRTLGCISADSAVYNQW